MAFEHHNLKYRTFNELLEDVNVDFSSYAKDSLIKPEHLIKIARKCNYALGLKLYQEKEEILEVVNGRVKLPNDFYILNYAFLCGNGEFTQALPQGTFIEERQLGAAPEYKVMGDPEVCADPEPEPDPCSDLEQCEAAVHLNNCGDGYQLIQKINNETLYYKYFYPLHIRKSKYICNDCPNTQWKSRYMNSQWDDNFYEGWFEQDHLFTNFDEGKVFINYMADLVDPDTGEILVPDHPNLNEFYEYSLKERVLENLVFAGKPVGELLNLANQKLRVAKIQAHSIVNMPDFAEIQKLQIVNRKTQYHKYFDMFRSYFTS